MDESHIWLAHLPSHQGTERLLKHLTADERERATNLRIEAHRQRWLITRALLRLLLGQYLDVPGRNIRFALGQHGKPHLAVPADAALHFNTSHSGDYAAFAFTRVGDVGVDIEQVRSEMPRMEEITRRYFAPGECRQLERLGTTERAKGFFNCWTRKEAFVKARGDGLFSGLDQFEVSLGEPRLLSVPNGSANDWTLVELPPIDGYAGAAVLRGFSHFRFYELKKA